MYSSCHEYVLESISCTYARRFIVRDFEYDPKAVKAEREAKKRLEDELKKQYVSDVELHLSIFHLYTLHMGQCTNFIMHPLVK